MESDIDRLKRLKAKANRLPLTPGVYIMKNSEGKIIYIGKAKAIKNRVTQYFSQKGQSHIKVQRMVDNVSDFDYILTDSEFEALVLECSLIKLHMPKYNILLKDDKGYHYLKITEVNGWKDFTAVHQRINDAAQYLGPYTGVGSLKDSVNDAKGVFMLRTCSKVFPRDIGKSRPCLNCYISRCCAPCTGKVSREEYNRSVDEAVEWLLGGGRDTVAQITAQMNKAADELDFERAAVLRDRIAAIERLTVKQKVFSKHKEQDVFSVVAGDGKACMAVLRFQGGQLVSGEHFFFDDVYEKGEIPAQLIVSYYSMRDRVPPRVLADGGVEDKQSVERFLTEKRGAKAEIAVPERGEQLELVKMCRENALQKLTERSAGKNGRELEGCLELQGMLKLEKLPVYIESYDISHTSGDEVVGGMVVFENGKPLKSAYKRFLIKSFVGQDDCRAMAEVLSRRFNEYKNSESDEGFGRLPDLILLDGGRAQVSAVLPVLQEYGVEVPLFGMVKDSKHRTAAIADGGRRVEFNVKRRAFTLVTQIQDEVHRFAIAYHRSRRSKKAFAPELCTIEGIGEKRASALLKRFKTLADIANASVQELEQTEGLSRAAAQSVYDYFHA